MSSLFYWIDTEFLTLPLKPLDPDKIILFGSYAYGTPTEESNEVAAKEWLVK
ncbi:MAG: hypothetical protein M0P91_14125 [Sulfuricurvum sp.]|uniref:hypothetical protein n=1 Tax=Sulfuricurvum sp. TaxID=2025608 RepID=UPI0025F6DCF3|nr:hypothetical protein [Sulfuricurvum sp.]MCK9374314.1 hypothetical protein [Sulfuricurvum sp.]